MKIEEAARKTLSEWSVSEQDIRKDPLFQLKRVRFKRKIRVSEIDRLLYSPRSIIENPISFSRPERLLMMK